jgi:hypothetical protein
MDPARLASAEIIEPPRRVGAVAGDALLDEVSSFLGRFVAYPAPEALTAHALWCAHAHLMGCWETTPRLAFLSPEPGSGKTRALEMTELLVPRPIMAVNMSSAALFRKVGDKEGLPTICFDEIDTVFGPKARENEELRGLLNAGYRRGAKTFRCHIGPKGPIVEEIEAFSAVALAGLGDLPDTILTRSIIVRMQRRRADEFVEQYRRRLNAAEGEALRAKLAAWTAAVEDRASTYIPDMPDGIEDRAADCWESLLTIADLAGGEWPHRARVSAVSLVSLARDRGQSLGIKLLEDLRTVFGDKDKLSTEQILRELIAIEESPWGDLHGKPLDARGLARRLKPYRAAPTQIREGEGTCKGYRREDLYDAWQRYALSPEKRETSETTGTCASCNGAGCLWCE